LREDVATAVADLEPRVREAMQKLADQLERGYVGRSPLLPHVALELYRMAGDPHVSFERISLQAVTDPGIAGRIVSLASSPFYAGGKVQGVKEALARIGLDGVRHIAFDSAYASRILRRGAHMEIVERSVRHARTMSALSRILARDVGVHPGSAALAALLHALGAIAVVDALSQGRSSLPGPTVIVAVRRTHAQIAGAVASTFSVEAPVVRALDGHHVVENRTPLAKLLHFVDLIAPGEPGARVVPLDVALHRSGLGLDEQRVRDRLLPILATLDDVRARITLSAAAERAAR
jgi:HD-like signal output (HDOD) protein